MDTLEEYEIYKLFRTQPDQALNEKLKFDSNVIFNALLGNRRLRPADKAEEPGVT